MSSTGISKTDDSAGLAGELATLRRRVDELAAKVQSLESGRSAAPAELEREAPVMAAAAGDNRDNLGDWLSRSSVLPRLAAVCFILVVALLLRTVTDYGYLDPGVGTLLGLAYVAILIGLGWYLYAGDRALAPIFAGCGFLLLFAILVESRNRFATLAPAPVMLILLAALGGGAFTGLRYRAAKVLSIGVIGAVVAGLAIDFPRVIFPAVGALLLVATLVAFLADRRGISRSLKWWVTLLALGFWFIWAFKIYMAWRHGEAPPLLFGPWFLPELLVFGGLYLGYYGRRYFRVAEITAFDAVLPSLNLLLLFLAGRVMVVTVWGQGTLFGVFAMILAAGHFLAGWRLSMLDRGRCGAIGGSMVGGAVMLALGLPELLGQVAWALPGWALVAYGLARLSGRCDSGVVRAISYLYQVFGFWIGLMTGVLTTVKPGQLPAALTAAAALAFCSLAQYRWCRAHPVPAGTLFSRLDGRDHSAVLLLLTGLGGCFFAGTMLLDYLAPLVLAEPANTLRCGRSLLLNGGALILMLAGSRYHRPELIWVAAALAVLGGFKVFFVDLFRSNGLPLVFSVLSFGLVAAVGSVLMGRRQEGDSGASRDKQGFTG